MKYKLSYAETPFEIKYWKYGYPELLKECMKEYIINRGLITYEIGKKLKEKGYPHVYNRFGCRPIYSDEFTIKHISNIGAYEQEYYGENIPCPTIDEVLKWLRKKREIDIAINPIIKYDDNLNRIREYNCNIFASQLNKPHCTSYCDSYEQAALAGIEYVLDNLI